MKSKIKERLLSLVARGGICIILFLILVGIKFFFPEIFEIVKKTLAKSTDVKKISSLLRSVVQEVLT